MPFDKSVWGTPAELDQKVFSKAANGKTCTSYFPDGRWNLSGWSTYPSKGVRGVSPDATRQSPPKDNRR